MERVSRDELCMQFAELVSQRGTCTRAKVGAVIAREGRVLVSGYNGPPAGFDHCAPGCGDDDPEKGCTRSVHAEANCIAFAARHGVAVLGADLYCSHLPCRKCAELIVNSGIDRVFYRADYRIKDGWTLLREAKIDMIRL